MKHKYIHLYIPLYHEPPQTVAGCFLLYLILHICPACKAFRLLLYIVSVPLAKRGLYVTFPYQHGGYIHRPWATS